MRRKLKRVDTLHKGPCDISVIVNEGLSYQLFHADRATEASVHVDGFFDFSSGTWKTFQGSGKWYRRSEVFALDGTDEDVRQLMQMIRAYDEAYWALRSQREAEYEKVRQNFRPAFDQLRKDQEAEITSLFEPFTPESE